MYHFLGDSKVSLSVIWQILISSFLISIETFYFVKKQNKEKFGNKIRRFRNRENMWWAWPFADTDLQIFCNELAVATRPGGCQFRSRWKSSTLNCSTHQDLVSGKTKNKFLIFTKFATNQTMSFYKSQNVLCWSTFLIQTKNQIVSCFQNCSEIIYIRKQCFNKNFFWNLRLKAENLQMFLRSLDQWKVRTIFETKWLFNLFLEVS